MLKERKVGQRDFLVCFFFFFQVVVSTYILSRNLNIPESLSTCIWLAFQPILPRSSCFLCIMDFIFVDTVLLCV